MKVILFATTTLLFLILIIAGFRLQVWQGESFFASARENTLEKRTVPAERGLIKDATGIVLAQSVLEEKDGVSKIKRFYPLGEDFAPILGFVGETEGKEGLEKTFNETLKGQSGAMVVEVNAKGEAVKTLSTVAPLKGNTLNLTIRADLQELAYNTLKEKKAKGAIIVSRAQSGDILAAVTYPSYDNNIFVEGQTEKLAKLYSDPGKPLFNRFLSGMFPPGSVFKLVMATGALMEGVLTTQTTLNAPGALTYGSFTYRDWRPSGHGIVDVVRALAVSADTFFYQVGGGYGSFKGLGVERIAAWAQKFGYGAPTGIDLPGEAVGLVPTPAWKEATRGEPWYIGNTYHLSIGQGDLLVTPLQMHMVTSAVAAGGKMYQPNLVEGKGKLKGDLGVSASIFSTLTQGMIGSCSPGGNAFPLYQYSPNIACKTGTAETGAKDVNHAWITLFFPVENPEYVMTVFLEGGGGGSEDAAPLAKTIYQYLLSGGKGDEARFDGR